MGWLIVDFPDLPWAMRKDMAQQAWRRRATFNSTRN